ncbi:MAG: glycogen-binding domain-containing protein [Candidatus Eisenbacteria bacterium]|nr:glycogen-binding domain-containing protein [Candidatus Eisenbacteria bacterium]
MSAEAARTALGKDPASVTLAGDFNNWSPNDAATACRLQDGVWTAVITLQPGKHTYKFVLDGGAKWKEDPSNSEKVDDGFGGSNSVVNVP